MSVLSKLKNIRKANRDYVDKQMQKIKSFVEKLPASPSDEEMDILDSDIHVLDRIFEEIKTLDSDILDMMGNDETADLSKEIEEKIEFGRRVYDTVRKIMRLAQTKEQNHSSARMQTQEKCYNNEEKRGFPIKDGILDMVLGIGKKVACILFDEVVVPAAIGFIKGKLSPAVEYKHKINYGVEAPSQFGILKSSEENPFPGVGWKQNMKQRFEAPVQIGLPPSFQDQLLRILQEGPK